jgi:hypothetical protein
MLVAAQEIEEKQQEDEQQFGEFKRKDYRVRSSLDTSLPFLSTLRPFLLVSRVILYIYI